MLAPQKRRSPSMLEQDHDLFEMANLYPETTGLPMTIWVSPRGRARHDARVKVGTKHGDSMDPFNTVVVAVRPYPRLLHGELAPRDLALVKAWVSLNASPLLEYWNGQIDTIKFGQRLRKV